MFTYGRPIERPPLWHRLQGGRGLEFPSVTQPVSTGRTVAYYVGADITACYTDHSLRTRFESFFSRTKL